MTTYSVLPTYFISHGGGPWPWMMGQMQGEYDHLAAALGDMPRQIGVTPKAVLVISGHWEEREFTVMANPRPPMIYDYGGFPEHTYHIRYAAPGAPLLAERVCELIRQAGFPARQDAQRGFDHGTYTPLALMYPNADVPVVQLSMRQGYDPRDHIAVGRALASLRHEGVLIVGSGLSYHNLRMFGPAAKEPSMQFDRWLQETLLTSSPSERINRLVDWESAPAARLVHPREDHLLPLMVAVGAAENDVASCVYHEDNFFGSISVSSFMFTSQACANGAFTITNERNTPVPC
ncbi:MAG TPA: class III extradiol ring-cleavage dioxygenase [Pseudomonadales bacterium]|nr:class III extradiol ring-cleavage dioxygenase [Pseudomonadales bacterium]